VSAAVARTHYLDEIRLHRHSCARDRPHRRHRGAARARPPVRRLMRCSPI
jgi:hypothetical protein